jgi:hypothetical protein
VGFLQGDNVVPCGHDGAEKFPAAIHPPHFFFPGTKALHVQVPAKTNLELPNAIARVKAPEESKAEQDRTPAAAPLKTHRGRTEPGQHSGDHTNMMGTKRPDNGNDLSHDNVHNGRRPTVCDLKHREEEPHRDSSPAT